MYIRNKVGPRTEPWGTLDVTLHGVEYDPSTTTCCDLSDRNDWIHCSGFPLYDVLTRYNGIYLGNTENITPQWKFPFIHKLAGKSAIDEVVR